MFFLRLHFQNYGTVGIGEPMGIRVPSRRSLFRSLSFLLPLCNEDTSPVTPALIFRGVTESPINIRDYYFISNKPIHFVYTIQKRLAQTTSF
ncbi:hypothetical protein HanPI659440_Chr03g0116421 [Helianthus annuus]|nr:hypothetical protein HanPI659440_Chr03g0116421 [Helianthus annuus]